MLRERRVAESQLYYYGLEHATNSVLIRYQASRALRMELRCWSGYATAHD